jgi:hypothetical protein
MLILIVGGKQIFGFAFGYAAIPWVTRSGYKAAFGVMAGTQVFLLLLAVPLWYYGKQIRQKSATWKLMYR